MHIKTETRVGLFIVLAVGVFTYMTFQVGFFRFDRNRYHSFSTHFADVAGLTRKADVKIAGVKVGWVDKLKLRNNMVDVKIMVLKSYDIHKDAYAIIRQDGLLGNKYLEVVPGDPLLPQLPSGSTFSKESRESVSVDTILHHVQKIASHMEEVTNSFKDVIGGQTGASRLEQTMENISYAAEKMALFADGIQRFMVQNEEHLSLAVQDVQSVAADLKNYIPNIGEDIRTIFHNVSTEILPEMRCGLGKISNAVDRDFYRIANNVETAVDSLSETSCEVRSGFKNISEVAEKINDGRGLLGKLINEDETYRDIKHSVRSVRNYFNKLDSLVVVIDSYSERWNRETDGLNFKNSKGYFYFRIYPSEDHYWLAGITTIDDGVVDRKVYLRQWFNNDGCELIPEDLELSDRDRLRFAPEVKVEKRRLDAVTYNAQYAKFFDHLAIRVGIFESTAGFAIDYDVPIPYCNDRLRWVTTLEAFDFNGRRRIDDQRVHLKWLNRIFFMRNFYATLGAEDFVSKHDKNAFFGVGIRFADDDLKYVLTRIFVTV